MTLSQSECKTEVENKNAVYVILNNELFRQFDKLMHYLTLYLYPVEPELYFPKFYESRVQRVDYFAAFDHLHPPPPPPPPVQ